MLAAYKKSYKEIANQILIINKDGIVLDFESSLFRNIKNKHISTVHPFFNTIIPLLNLPNKIWLLLLWLFPCAIVNVAIVIVDIISDANYCYC